MAARLSWAFRARGSPSRLGWLHRPGLGLSAGGLFGVQLSRVEGWGGKGEPSWRVLCRHGTLLELAMPRACVKGPSPSQEVGRGAVRGPLAAGSVFDSMRACFYEFGQIYFYMITKIKLVTD